MGFTNPEAGVMATRPATAPAATPRTLGCLFWTQERVIQVNPANPDMLAHIHTDTCPGAGPVAWPLTNVVNGQSTTDIDAPSADVLARGKSINLHKSPSDSGVYVGCGNLMAAGAGGAAQVPARLPATGDLGAVAPLLSVLGAGLLGAGTALRRRRG